MDTSKTRISVDRILEDDLSSLPKSGGRSVFPAPISEGWRLPDQGRVFLSSYGLPSVRTDDLMGIVGEFQESETPEIGGSGLQYYVLGRYGVARMAAVQGSGEVLALPRSSEVHSAISHLYPAGLTPVPANSSLEQFVECAWRWHWIVPLLAAMEKRAGEAEIMTWKEGGRLDSPDPYDDYEQVCDHVLEKFQEIDRQIGLRCKFWTETITSI
ncbi:SUKH-4 family immunity protein [Actinomadura darangshiensis]|uniref:SUKH-4 family immunity protein n=1 Tax=Actinomadura darangshiensis TaxID=705336 RepID=UPI00140C641B|nr:SUKH-4 family immunity protein [Actinomadura darangshiensis]